MAQRKAAATEAKSSDPNPKPVQAAREDGLKSLIANIPGMVYRGNADWSTEIISGSKDLCGYTPEEIQGQEMSWLDVIHTDDREKISSEAAQLQHKAVRLVQTYRIVRKDGEIRWVEDRKTSTFAKDGSFLGVDGVVLDVTDRLKVEQDLRLFRELIDQANDIICIIDPESGRLLEFNSKLIEASGYSREELQHMGVTDVEGTLPSMSAFRQFVDSVREAGSHMMEGILKHKDGTGNPIEVNCRWFARDAENYVVCVVRDITEQKKRKEEEQRTATALAAAEAEKKKADELRAANQQLRASEQQLRASEQQLRAQEQTLRASREELQRKVSELERFNRLMVGREMQMVDLKAEINSLLAELGRPPAYQVSDKRAGTD